MWQCSIHLIQVNHGFRYYHDVLSSSVQNGLFSKNNGMQRNDDILSTLTILCVLNIMMYRVASYWHMPTQYLTIAILRTCACCWALHTRRALLVRSSLVWMQQKGLNVLSWRWCYEDFFKCSKHFKTNKHKKNLKTWKLKACLLC